MRTRLLRLAALGMSAIMAGSIFVGGVAADPGGLPDFKGIGLVEVNVPSRAAIDGLNTGEWDLAEYVRAEGDGSFTIQVNATKDGIAELAAMGYGIGAVIEDEDTWYERRAEREATIAAKNRAAALAEGGVAAAGDIFSSFVLPPLEVTIMRAVTYENYAGRYLYVEARTSEGLPGNAGPTMAMSWNEGNGATFGEAVPMGKFTDTDPTPDVYMYHRDLVRISGPGMSEPAYPSTIRVASSVGGVAEAPVVPWLGGGLSPVAEGYLTDFIDHYMHTYELHETIEQLAADFPDLAEVIELPYETYGYQQPAMGILNGTANIGNAPANNNQGGSTAVNQARSVVIFTKAMGHLGGNAVTLEFLNPGAPDSPLSIAVTGSDITVTLATDAGGATTSTAAQVVAALNASAASTLVEAQTWAGNAGGGVVLPRARVNMSDFLNAPAEIPRGPIKNKMLRIGKTRDGSGVGIFLYCNQHAREWVTPVTCIETAHRTLYNYGIDPKTKEFVDNLDIFIIPTQNPGGNIVSLYDFQSKRRTTFNYCRALTPTSTNAMPSARNSWGVDMNRNSTQYTLFDGYGGASTNCTSDVYAGPFEASEPEIQNEIWVSEEFPNIKFANNIHTSGGYFMWAPGSYINNGRITAPAPNIGVEAYFFETADTVLGRIAETRGTVIPPERTGPIADVLYSAAGNSADDQWYRKGIISYSFEAGADRHNLTARQPVNVDAAVGATAIRLNSTASLAAGDSIVIEPGTANEETAVVVSLNSAAVAPDPNVFLAKALTKAHAAGAAVSEVTFSGVGFFPNYATEGEFEAFEFAHGNYGLFEGALAYMRDNTAPTVDILVCDELMPAIECDEANGGGAKQTGSWITTFAFGNEPSVVRYTTDGSTPNMSSPTWEAQGPRMPGQLFQYDETTTIKWFGVDIKGNVGAIRSATFHVDDVDPTITITEPQDAGGVGGAGLPGNYALGSEHFADYACDDDDSGVVSCVGTVADGAAFDTSTVGFHDFTVDAEDWAGNTASLTHTYNVYFPGNSGALPPVLGPGPYSAQAASSVPVRFSLGGVDYGLDILADGYPRSTQVDCTTGALLGDPEFAPSEGNVGLEFEDGKYKWVWKTSRTYRNTCRLFEAKLVDNSVISLTFKF